MGVEKTFLGDGNQSFAAEKMQTKVISSTPDTLTTILMLPAQIYFQPWPSFSRTLISHSQLDALLHLKVNMEGPINHLPVLPTFPPTLWAPWLTLLLSLSSRLKTCHSYFLLCFSHLIVTTNLPNSFLSVLLMSSSHSPLKPDSGGRQVLVTLRSSWDFLLPVSALPADAS